MIESANILQNYETRAIYILTHHTMKKDKRITIALSEFQHNYLVGLSDRLDVDQGKAIRWMLKTCLELSDPEQVDLGPIRDQLTPPAKYLLDTMSMIHIE